MLFLCTPPCCFAKPTSGRTSPLVGFLRCFFFFLRTPLALLSAAHLLDSISFISYAPYLQQILPGEGKRAYVLWRLIFNSVTDAMVSRYYFRLKIYSYMALRPGEGARALRFALCPLPGAPSPSTHKRLLYVRSPAGLRFLLGFFDIQKQ